MTKSADQIKPNYAPVYAAALYPKLAKICIANGWALAVHGSLARDFDVIAIPWVEKVTPPEQVVKLITENFAAEHIGEIGYREHGRTVYTLSIGFGECALDFSFMPTAESLASELATLQEHHPPEREDQQIRDRGRTQDLDRG
jgi:hypothetical protein